MINWNKSNCIFKANGQFPFMQTHTAMPIPLHLHDDVFRIYFSTRGIRNNPQVGYIEIDIKEPKNILKISDKPVLENGPEGHFDYNGLYSGCIVKRDDEHWMYYSGRTNLENGMYNVEVGLAISNDGGLTFKKYSESPIFGRNINDPWLVSTPHVIPYNDGWRMYYLSGRFVNRVSEKLYFSPYDIRSALSKDGINWQSENYVHIPLTDKRTQISAPNILKITNNLFLMIYSYIENYGSYKLGCSYSNYLNNWKDLPDFFDFKVYEDWDISKSYPSVIIHKNELIIIFSGHNYGKEGLGILKTNLEEVEHFIT